MARPQKRCPSCHAVMVCDDCTRIGGQWVDIYLCPACGKKQNLVVMETPAPQVSPPSRIPEPSPAPPPPPQPEPAPSEAAPLAAQGPSSLEVFLDRAMLLVGDYNGMSRQDIDRSLSDESYWEERRGWDDFSEYPLA